MSIKKVAKFHAKFGLPVGAHDLMVKPTVGQDPLTHDSLEDEAREIQKFRVKFMQEELDEFILTLANKDRVAAFDALLDLVYVAQGTALFMGVNSVQWRAGMRAVHRANMSKVRANSSAESKRGTKLDVVKPEGWAPPERELEEILSWK